AIRLQPTEVFLNSNKGIFLYELRRYEEALATFELVTRLDPSFADAHYDKGRTLSALNRYEEALIAYEQAMKLDPKYTQGYNDAFQRLEALAAYEKESKAASSSPEAAHPFNKFTEHARKVLS